MKRPLVYLAVLYIILLLTANLFHMERYNLFDEFDGEHVAIEGVVSDIYITDYGYQFLTVNAYKIDEAQYRGKISVSVKVPHSVQYGQGVRIKGIAEKLSFKRNPGGVSERVYMGARGFGGKLEGHVITMGGIESRYIFYSKGLSNRLSSLFHQNLPMEMAAVMDAVVLGDKVNITDEIADNFRATGASYILSISGLNITCISAAVFWLLRKMGAGLKSGSLLVVVILTFYCLFTGASVSTVRAVLMASIAVFGYVLNRTPDIYSSLALTALILLIRTPLFLLDAGFLLSFSAVIGIAYLTPRFEKALSFLNVGCVRLSGYIAATLAATAAVTPILAYFFGCVSVFSIFVSLLILPFLSILTCAGFMFIFLGAGPLSVVLASVMYAILKYYLFITEFFSKLPYSVITTGSPKLYSILFYYAILFLICLYLDHPDEKRRVCVTAVSATILTVALNISSAIRENRFEIAFLDVKQGDCSVVHLPDNINLLIDGGGSLLAEIGTSTGKNVVLPYMNHKGIKSLNAVFLSHPDIDHAGGIIEIMSLMKVGRLFIPDCNFDESSVMKLVLDTAASKGVPVSRIRAGYTAKYKDMLLSCHYPIYRGKPEQMNNSSLVLKLTYKGRSFLFTGDVETVDEFGILASGDDISSDLIKVPHHGSDTSSNQEFIEAVSPIAAIVGAGKNNQFGHPDAETVKLFESKGIPLYNTAYEGAVFINTNGKEILITTMREKDE